MSRLVLCAPLSDDGSGLEAALVSGTGIEREGELLNVGGVRFALELCPPDGRMVRAFESCRCLVHPTLSDSELDAIAAHDGVAYLVSEPFSTADEALATAQRGLFAACRLLECGVLGVKSESAGIAHGADHWFALYERVGDGQRRMHEGDEDGGIAFFESLFQAWVRRPIADGDLWFTIGMAVLGRPDVVIRRSEHDSDGAALMLLDIFATYQMAEAGPDDLAHGQTFGLAPDAPSFRLSFGVCHYPESDDELFYNPWGAWWLTLADGEAPLDGDALELGTVGTWGELRMRPNPHKLELVFIPELAVMQATLSARTEVGVDELAELCVVSAMPKDAADGLRAERANR